MNEGTMQTKAKFAWVAGALIAVGAIGWAAWGSTAWKIHQAKNKILVEATVTEAAFRDVRLGNDHDTVCGWVAVEPGGAYRRFMVDRVAPVIDPAPGNEGFKAILWEDYPRKCANLRVATSVEA